MGSLARKQIATRATRIIREEYLMSTVRIKSYKVVRMEITQCLAIEG